MKPAKKYIISLFVLGGFVALISLLPAQEAELQTEVVPATPGSIVQLTAEADGLSPVSPQDLPENGTFWNISSNGVMAPWPCPPPNLSLPIYGIADGVFLVDSTGGQVAMDDQESVEDALAGLADSVADLIGWIQEAQLTRSLAVAFGMEEELDAPSGFSSMTVSYDTNALYLVITNVAGGQAGVELHHGTNTIYAIWSTTNLPGGWQVEREVWPTNAEMMPFTVPTLNRDNLFLRAEDWSTKDSDGDGVPDWWGWQYFGTTAIAGTNLDYSNNGLTFAEDYSNNVPPTVFTFSGVSVANNYVSSSQPAVQLDMTGHPYYIATLVDDGNFSNAVWNTFSGSSVTVNLGLTEGWHEVWIGLRGHADEVSSAVWQWKRVRLDWTPPLLVVTNPMVAGGAATVDVPLIQLMGYSPEALSSISYDLTNAFGLVTNQQVLITDQYYSTNTWEFTTNYFQGFDIFLTNGLNQITLHATDLAGNVTTSNYNFTVDYSSKTNPPVVQIFWPQAGQQIGGNNYTVRGWVNDPTALVTAVLVIDGTSNTYAGVLERDGHFWVDNLPLTAGTNGFTLEITDAAGNLTTTNLWVIKSPVEFSITPPDPNSLWNTTITVTGTINTNNWTVWGNGVQGVNNGDGTFSIPNVPMDPGGSSTINVTLFPPGQNPGGGGNGGNGGSGGSGGGAGSANPSDPNAPSLELNQEKPMRLYVASDEQKRDYQWHKRLDSFDWEGTHVDWGEYWEWSTSSHGWLDKSGGTGDWSDHNQHTDTSGITDTTCSSQITWPGSAWPNLSNGVQVASGDCNSSGLDETNAVGPPYIAMEHCDVTAATSSYSRDWYGQAAIWLEAVAEEQYTRKAQTKWQLQTGGRAVPGVKNLFVISGSATEILDKRAVPPFYYANTRAIPPEDVQIGALGNLDTNGNLYVVLPNGDPPVTPVVKNKDFYTFYIGAQKYTLVSMTHYPALTDTNRSRTSLGVGEEVDLGFNPEMPYEMSAKGVVFENGWRSDDSADEAGLVRIIFIMVSGFHAFIGLP